MAVGIPSAPMRLLEPPEPPYPRAMLELDMHPPPLWAIGEPGVLDAPTVTIVGTRHATAYGERVARQLARALARSGVCVASGMARGIDAAAHEAALEAGGCTAAVLGTGADVPYPIGHRDLHRRIAASGAVLSEMPPGTRAFRGCFPRRNRILAALAKVTIVVEAPERSGALTTARAATDFGRTVAAVPGPIDAPTSVGTNDLLRCGAVVIADIGDALTLFGIDPKNTREITPHLSPDAMRVWDALARGSADLDTLAARTRLPAARCLAAVTDLELAGAVYCELTGEIRRA